MNGVYKSLKVKMQDTFQLAKSDPAPAAPKKSSSSLSLNEEMETLERAVTEGLGKLKAAVKRDEATMAGTARQAEQVVGSLKESIAALEAKLKETEQAVRQKDSSRQQIEETLKAKIHELQQEVIRKEQELAAHAKEIDSLKASVDARMKQFNELESASAKAKREAAGDAQRAGEAAAISQAAIEKLQAQLKENEELARRKDASIQELEQTLAAKIQDFENLAKSKQELLAGRDAVISDLKSQLKLLTKGIGEMSSFFKQAQAFAVVHRQDANPSTAHGPVNNREEIPAWPANSVKGVASEEEKRQAVRSSAGTMPSLHEKTADVVQLDGATAAGSIRVEATPAEKKPDGAEANGQSTAPKRGADAAEILSQALLEQISGELAEVAGVMSPLATLIIREHAEGLGESVEKFPKSRFSELIDSLARELLDEKRQADFRVKLAGLQPTAFRRHP